MSVVGHIDEIHILSAVRTAPIIRCRILVPLTDLSGLCLVAHEKDGHGDA